MNLKNKKVIALIALIATISSPMYSATTKKNNTVKENVIENKSRIAYGLNDNGIIIIPNQKEYNTKEKMTNYIKKINPILSNLQLKYLNQKEPMQQHLLVQFLKPNMLDMEP